MNLITGIIIAVVLGLFYSSVVVIVAGNLPLAIFMMVGAACMTALMLVL